ncbi:mycofactocin biosynthesis peptidyl-dipeptidase MftE [Rhodococcus aerolatus]
MRGVTALAGLRWPDVPDGAVLVVPVGSTEQHGPHLPLDTDTRVAAAVAARLVETTPGALLGAPVAYGASGEHEHFPGTVSIGTDVLARVLLELGRSAGRWAPRLLLVNGHGGNGPALVRAVPQLREEGRDAAWWPCAVPRTPEHPADAHAGRTETSLLLHLDPAAVDLGRAAAGDTRPTAELMPLLRAGGVAAVSPNGVLGDPAGASAQEGARLLADLVDRGRDALGRWTVSEHGVLG